MRKGKNELVSDIDSCLPRISGRQGWGWSWGQGWAGRGRGGGGVGGRAVGGRAGQRPKRICVRR